uniref:Coactosin-like protein n=1 Tax=Prolemur simus TaxID=1328070 RepID=A0A8C8Z557_PROSS
MATKIDKEACRAAYNLVRDDSSAVIWVTFKYDGPTIVPGEQGAEYQHFIQECTDDVRLFAFVRFTTGDAMSKRSKFALITWIGENVSGLQRAKTGTDKTLVKEVVQNFAKEFVISDRKELEEDFIKSELKKPHPPRQGHPTSPPARQAEEKPREAAPTTLCPHPRPLPASPANPAAPHLMKLMEHLSLIFFFISPLFCSKEKSFGCQGPACHQI